MKILYYTNVPSPYRVEFFNQLSQTDEVTVLFNNEKREKFRNPKWYKDNKYNFNYINVKKFTLFQLNQLLNKNNYDIIIIGTYANLNGAFLNILLRLKKKIFFLNADGGFIAEKESIISKFLKRTFISSASYYLSTGKETNKYLTYYGAQIDKIFIYPFSSLKQSDILSKPVPYKQKMAMRRKKGYPYKRLFISVGSFIYRKGYDIFLQSLQQLQYEDVGFLIIGGGTEKNNYEKMIIENNIKNVHLIDFCSKKEIFDYYKMADVFFFPSREDIWGLVINEAMANGLPIISSDKVIAALELLEKDNIYPCNDIKLLSRKIKKYINQPEEKLYQEGINNLEKISRYTIENGVVEHKKIFEVVLQKNRRTKNDNKKKR